MVYYDYKIGGLIGDFIIVTIMLSLFHVLKGLNIFTIVMNVIQGTQLIIMTEELAN